MSYEFITVEHFWSEVEGNQPPTEPGGKWRGKFHVKYRRFKKSEFKELASRGLSDDEYLDAVVLEVKDFRKDGQALDSAAALDVIKDDVALSLAVIMAFAQGLAGGARKN